MDGDKPQSSAMRNVIVVCVIVVTIVLVAYLITTSPLCEMFNDGTYIGRAGKCVEF